MLVTVHQFDGGSEVQLQWRRPVPSNHAVCAAETKRTFLGCEADPGETVAEREDSRT